MLRIPVWMSLGLVASLAFSASMSARGDLSEADGNTTTPQASPDPSSIAIDCIPDSTDQGACPAKECSQVTAAIKKRVKRYFDIKIDFYYDGIDIDMARSESFDNPKGPLYGPVCNVVDGEGFYYYHGIHSQPNNPGTPGNFHFGGWGGHNALGGHKKTRDGDNSSADMDCDGKDCAMGHFNPFIRQFSYSMGHGPTGDHGQRAATFLERSSGNTIPYRFVQALDESTYPANLGIDDNNNQQPVLRIPVGNRLKSQTEDPQNGLSPDEMQKHWAGDGRAYAVKMNCGNPVKIYYVSNGQDGNSTGSDEVVIDSTNGNGELESSYRRGAWIQALKYYQQEVGRELAGGQISLSPGCQALGGTLSQTVQMVHAALKKSTPAPSSSPSPGPSAAPIADILGSDMCTLDERARAENMLKACASGQGADGKAPTQGQCYLAAAMAGAQTAYDQIVECEIFARADSAYSQFLTFATHAADDSTKFDKLVFEKVVNYCYGLKKTGTFTDMKTLQSQGINECRYIGSGGDQETMNKFQECYNTVTPWFFKYLVELWFPRNENNSFDPLSSSNANEATLPSPYSIDPTQQENQCCSSSKSCMYQHKAKPFIPRGLDKEFPFFLFSGFLMMPAGRRRKRSLSEIASKALPLMALLTGAFLMQACGSVTVVFKASCNGADGLPITSPDLATLCCNGDQQASPYPDRCPKAVSHAMQGAIEAAVQTAQAAAENMQHYQSLGSNANAPVNGGNNGDGTSPQANGDTSGDSGPNGSAAAATAGGSTNAAPGAVAAKGAKDKNGTGPGGGLAAGRFVPAGGFGLGGGLGAAMGSAATAGGTMGAGDGTNHGAGGAGAAGAGAGGAGYGGGGAPMVSTGDGLNGPQLSAPAGGSDAVDYFTRIPHHENLFQIVERKYKKKQYDWAREDGQAKQDQTQRQFTNVTGKKIEIPEPSDPAK